MLCCPRDEGQCAKNLTDLCSHSVRGTWPAEWPRGWLSREAEGGSGAVLAAPVHGVRVPVHGVWVVKAGKVAVGGIGLVWVQWWGSMKLQRRQTVVQERGAWLCCARGFSME